MTTMTLPEVGSSLNGRIVLATKRTDDHEAVILCVLPGEVAPFVIWRYGEPDDASRPPLCYSGDYQFDLKTALKAFEAR